jgi:protein SCO1
MKLLWALVGAVAVVAVVGIFAAKAVIGRSTAAPRPANTTLVGEAVMTPGTTPAPDFSLRDQNGRLVTVHDFRGRVVAVTFLDSHCKEKCPLEGEQLGQTMRALGTATPFTLLVVSVAPSTDTPQSANAFAATHHWTAEWHWLAGSQSALAAVWKAYGIDVEPGVEGSIPHSVALYLLDRRGYERAGFLFTDPPRLEQDIRILARS